MFVADANVKGIGMSFPRFEIRAARKDDITALVPLHEQAFAGSLGVSLGRRYVLAFLTWFINEPTAINLVAVHDQELVGYVFGAPDGYGNRLNRELFLNISLAILTHPWLVLKTGFLIQIPSRLRSLVGFNRYQKGQIAHGRAAFANKLFRLVGVGVALHYRRTGVARTLIEAFADQIWSKSYEAIELSVYRNNAAACALYKACGWRKGSDQGKVLTYAVSKPTASVRAD
jgi:ribosomal protein S18 acetylase RimI-like enzyme